MTVVPRPLSPPVRQQSDMSEKSIAVLELLVRDKYLIHQLFFFPIGPSRDIPWSTIAGILAGET